MYCSCIFAICTGLFLFETRKKNEAQKLADEKKITAKLRTHAAGCLFP
jgi:hypothetical protein